MIFESHEVIFFKFSRGYGRLNPRQESEESRGSLPALTNPHAAGTCQPCVLFAATVGCHKGERCQFCHMPHAPDARSTTRGVRKHTRDSIKQRVTVPTR